MTGSVGLRQLIQHHRNNLPTWKELKIYIKKRGQGTNFEQKRILEVKDDMIEKMIKEMNEVVQ